MDCYLVMVFLILAYLRRYKVYSNFKGIIMFLNFCQKVYMTSRINHINAIFEIARKVQKYNFLNIRFIERILFLMLL